MTQKALSVVFLILLGFNASISYAHPFVVTNEKIDEMIQFGNKNPQLYATDPTIRKIKFSQEGKNKGVVLDLWSTCEIDCSDIAALRNQLYSKSLNSKDLDGFIPWLWDGFYIKYRFHFAKLSRPITVVVDRFNLFGQPISEIYRYDQHETLHSIAIPHYLVSMLSSGTALGEVIAAGHPLKKTICDIAYQEERYYFQNGSLDLQYTVNVIPLSSTKSQDEQVKCIVEDDIQTLTNISGELTAPYPDTTEASIPRLDARHLSKDKMGTYATHLVVDNFLIYISFFSTDGLAKEDEITKIAASLKVTPSTYVPHIEPLEIENKSDNAIRCATISNNFTTRIE